MPWCTCIIIPWSADATEYSRHNSSQYRCLGVLASSFPGVQMPRSIRAIIPHSADALVYLHHHSPECRCHGVLAPSFLKVQMPSCTVTVLLAPSFPGVQMLWGKEQSSFRLVNDPTNPASITGCLPWR